MSEQYQSRLLLLPGTMTVNRPGNVKASLSVYIVDYRFHTFGGTVTCVLREPVPDDVTWTGSRMPGGIFQSDTDDVVVALGEVAS